MCLTTILENKNVFHIMFTSVLHSETTAKRPRFDYVLRLLLSYYSQYCYVKCSSHFLDYAYKFCMRSLHGDIQVLTFIVCEMMS